MATSQDNGRGRLWVPKSEIAALVRPGHNPTVQEWLERPNVGATRAEVAAFGEALTLRMVAPLIKAALEEYDARRWHRRVQRFFTRLFRRPTISHHPKPLPVDPAFLEDAKEGLGPKLA
jgi:hypothetical protein